MPDMTYLTRRPWRVGGHQILDGYGFPLAHADETTTLMKEEAEANLHLMALAPELWDLMTGIVLTMYPPNHPDQDWTADTIACIESVLMRAVPWLRTIYSARDVIQRSFDYLEKENPLHA